MPKKKRDNLVEWLKEFYDSFIQTKASITADLNSAFVEYFIEYGKGLTDKQFINRLFHKSRSIKFDLFNEAFTIYLTRRIGREPFQEWDTDYYEQFDRIITKKEAIEIKRYIRKTLYKSKLYKSITKWFNNYRNTYMFDVKSERETKRINKNIIFIKMSDSVVKYFRIAISRKNKNVYFDILVPLLGSLSDEPVPIKLIFEKGKFKITEMFEGNILRRYSIKDINYRNAAITFIEKQVKFSSKASGVSVNLYLKKFKFDPNIVLIIPSSAKQWNEFIKLGK